MLIIVFFARVDKAIALRLFLGFRVILLVMAVTDRAGVIQVSPDQPQAGIAPLRLEVIYCHRVLTAEAIIRHQAIGTPATKKGTKV
jgi:hypothetical protein